MARALIKTGKFLLKPAISCFALVSSSVDLASAAFSFSAACTAVASCAFSESTSAAADSSFS